VLRTTMHTPREYEEGGSANFQSSNNWHLINNNLVNTIHFIKTMTKLVNGKTRLWTLLSKKRCTKLNQLTGNIYIKVVIRK